MLPLAPGQQLDQRVDQRVEQRAHGPGAGLCRHRRSGATDRAKVGLGLSLGEAHKREDSAKVKDFLSAHALTVGWDFGPERFIQL